MRYVGIDPSLKTGIAILYDKNSILYSEHNHGFVDEITPKSKDYPRAFEEIGSRILDCLEFDDVVCIEGFSYGSKGKGVSTQYGLGWIIRYLLHYEGIKYIDVPPTLVKKFATGKGNVKKDAMVLPIFKHWEFEHDSDNVRDAYVLARIAMALNGKESLTKYQEECIKKIKRA